ncbi:DUF4249 family protein [Lewinella sp. IMCC34191]|uniref:DUF4249 family protein n=1 Tax=Lewinella sp. IMCC34191 TaxID=2259172 RepID=UPI000E220934|nr:DUF4249 family protein [Lewinella sp. IMCC34191]
MNTAALPALLLLCLFLTGACTDPIHPNFVFEEGFLVVDGRITDQPGKSFVSIRRNVLLYENYRLVAVEGARVTSRDDLGETVEWVSDDTVGYFRPPDDFTAMPGRQYAITIATTEGELIESPLQALPPPVSIRDVDYRFDQEAYFSELRDRFVPALTFYTTVADPPDVPNYFLYRLRKWERQSICATCTQGRYRGGVCVEDPNLRNVAYYDYLCSTTCWEESRVPGRRVFRDEFSDGTLTEGIEAGRIDLDRSGGLLVEIEQASINSSTYDFSRNLLDLTEGGGGLNAPLPAPLIGNLVDKSAWSTTVLGNLSLESLTVARIFVDRSELGGTPLPPERRVNLEPAGPDRPTAPCEGANRSPIAPDGWLE